MKDYALRISEGSDEFLLYKKHLSAKKFEKVSYFCRADYARPNLTRKIYYLEPEVIGNRRLLIIDGKILFELLRFPQSDPLNTVEKTRYVGYLLSRNLIVKSSEGDYSYIEKVESEVRNLLKIN